MGNVSGHKCANPLYHHWTQDALAQVPGKAPDPERVQPEGSFSAPTADVLESTRLAIWGHSIFSHNTSYVEIHIANGEWGSWACYDACSLPLHSGGVHAVGLHFII